MTPAERAARQRRANGAGLLSFIEPAATMLSGIGAQAVSGAAALPTLFMGNDERSGVDTYVDAQRKMQESMTYQPRSAEGQKGLLDFVDTISPAVNAIESGQRYLGDREMSSVPDNWPTAVKAIAGTAGYMGPDLVLAALGVKPLLSAARNLSRKAGVPEFGADVAPFKKPGFEKELGATAWHGSPHKWDKVDLDKVGTGEGGQAFGHGFYSAQNKSVAEGYEAMTPAADIRRSFLKELPEDADFDDVKGLLDSGSFNESQKSVIKALQKDDWLGFDYPSQAISAAYTNLDNYDPSPALKAAVNNSGNMYELDINDESIKTMLDWDDDISNQPAIKEKVQDLLATPYEDSNIYKQMKNKGFDSETLQKYLPAYESRKAGVQDILDGRMDSNRGGDLYHALKNLTGQDSPAAAGLLNDAGVKGVKYLDGNSRGANKGTSNYVNFDANDVSVVSRNGDPIPVEGLLGKAKKKPVPGGVKANAETAGNYHPVGLGRKLKNTPSDIVAHKIDMDGVAPYKNVDVESLLGKTIISATGDTTDAGKILTGIGDVEFDKPVELLGGAGNQQLGSAFASAAGNLKTIQNRAKAAIEAGSEPVISYTGMGFGSSNFNTMMSDTTLQMMHSNPAIPKRAKKAFDKELRAISPNWKGIDHPEASAQLRDTTGALRTDFMKVAGLSRYQDAGFPNLTDVRAAITAPSMLNAPDYHSGHNMSATDGTVDQNPRFNHPTYDTHLKQTEYLGGLAKPLPMETMFPDFFKQAAEKGLTGPKRAFELSKPSQLVTPELVDIWGEAMEPFKSNELFGKAIPHGGQRGGMSEPLPGAPSTRNIPNYGPARIGPNRDIDFALDNYAKQVDHSVNKPDKYVPLDEKFAGETGREFEAMEADWDSPAIQASYKSLITDISKQYEEALRAGITPKFIDGDNPYQSSPSLSLLDMANKRELSIFPTKDGYGPDDAIGASNNPMLRESPYKIDGQPMLWNDVFRFVHDAYGHGATGAGFRAAGEDNAYISHFSSLSPESRLALANETRGQNTALNYGKHGEHNRTANQDDTIFQDQKAGLLSNKAIYGNINKAFDERKVLKGGLLGEDPRLKGAINDEGLLSMKHFANQELDSIDPAKYGSGLAGRTMAEKNRSYHPDFLDRSYFGIDADENPYRREAGLGGIEHESTIAPEHIYDADKDPEGLLGGPEDFTTKEKAIFESGYSGFLTNHPRHGKVAIVFDKLEAKRLKESGFAHPIMLAAQGAAGAAVMYYAGQD